MSIKDYSSFVTRKATDNFGNNNKYFNFESTLFVEFSPLVHQINNCLILELHIPALTATNYLLERLLKVALIYNEVKSNSVDIEKLNSLYEIPNKKYTKLNFDKTIEKCRNIGLIDDAEQKFLDKKIRPLIRNPYSHGDPTKIRNTLPKKTIGFVASFSEPTKLEEIEFENSCIPTFQSRVFEDFAKANSLIYFDFAFNLISNIENKINHFHKNHKN